MDDPQARVVTTLRARARGLRTFEEPEPLPSRQVRVRHSWPTVRASVPSGAHTANQGKFALGLEEAPPQEQRQG